MHQTEDQSVSMHCDVKLSFVLCFFVCFGSRSTLLLLCMKYLTSQSPNRSSPISFGERSGFRPPEELRFSHGYACNAVCFSLCFRTFNTRCRRSALMCVVESHQTGDSRLPLPKGMLGQASARRALLHLLFSTDSMDRLVVVHF